MHEILEDSTELVQEISTPAQNWNVQDEFQVEVNRMRNSLSALTLRHFMFESGSKENLLEGHKPDAVSELVKVIKPNDVQTTDIVALETDVQNTKDDSMIKNIALLKAPTVEQAQSSPNVTIKTAFKNETEVPFERRLSKHRKDPNRTKSGHVHADEIIAALSESQSKLHDPKKVDFVTARPFKAPGMPQKSVIFDEVQSYKPTVLFKELSRDSDEVAGITELPWHKKHEYRTVTPFFKKANRAVSHDDLSDGIVFRPIEISRSTEDINKAIIKPVPVFASKSYQEIPVARSIKPFNHFQTKSSDDLLFDNIDGIRKPESKRHKLMRIRSTSSNTLNRLSDQLVYENFHYVIPETASVSNENFMRKKAPRPLPRIVDETVKRNSKTIVYVLDKERDEFVLEEDGAIEDAYEDVVMQNQSGQYSDYTFDSLLDSRDDCECDFQTLGSKGD